MSFLFKLKAFVAAAMKIVTIILDVITLMKKAKKAFDGLGSQQHATA